MALEGYYRTAGDAKQIRTVTRQAVQDVLTDILQEEGLTVGGDGVELVNTMSLASNRLREAKPFALLTMQPLKPERAQVQHPDTGAAHSGRKLPWRFLIAASRGSFGGRVAAEVRKAQDDELNNAIWFGFESRYTYFRDTLKFFELSVGMSDEQRESSMISNLLLLQFHNFIRMPTDELIES